MIFHVKKLHQIGNDKGNLIKIRDKNDASSFEIKEIYQTDVIKSAIKGWKLHKKMTCRLYVINGIIDFYFSLDLEKIDQKIRIGSDQNELLVVQPNVWFAFKGVCSRNSMLNFASVWHEEDPGMNKPLSALII